MHAHDPVGAGGYAGGLSAHRPDKFFSIWGENGEGALVSENFFFTYVPPATRDPLTSPSPAIHAHLHVHYALRL